jgi:hypothetical protein
MGVKGRWEIIDGIQGRFSRKVPRRPRSMEKLSIRMGNVQGTGHRQGAFWCSKILI